MKRPKYLLEQLLLTEEEIAYHGTPNQLVGNKFDLGAIGMGTGAQAYGWGLYFGKSPDLARGFVQKRHRKITLDGQLFYQLGYKYDNPAFFALPTTIETLEQLIEYAEDTIEILNEDPDETTEEIVEQYEKLLKVVQTLGKIESKLTGYFYKVLLHPGKSPNEYEYLNWDKPVPEDQIQKVEKQLQKENINLNPNNTSGQVLYHQLQKYYENLGSTNAPKDASLFLLRAGFAGNTHSGGNVRILFSDKPIKILDVEEIH